MPNPVNRTKKFGEIRQIASLLVDKAPICISHLSRTSQFTNLVFCTVSARFAFCWVMSDLDRNTSPLCTILVRGHHQVGGQRHGADGASFLEVGKAFVFCLHDREKSSSLC